MAGAEGFGVGEGGEDLLKLGDGGGLEKVCGAVAVVAGPVSSGDPLPGYFAQSLHSMRLRPGPTVQNIDSRVLTRKILNANDLCVAGEVKPSFSVQNPSINILAIRARLFPDSFPRASY